MLTVRSASLHQKDPSLPGAAGLSPDITRLKPDRYPISATLMGLVCVIDFHCYGRMNEQVSIRARRVDEVLHETTASPYRGPYSIASHDFTRETQLPGIVFPAPGNYHFDILINEEPSYTLELDLL